VKKQFLIEVWTFKSAFLGTHLEREVRINVRINKLSNKTLVTWGSGKSFDLL